MILNRHSKTAGESKVRILKTHLALYVHCLLLRNHLHRLHGSGRPSRIDHNNLSWLTRILKVDNLLGLQTATE